MLPDSARLVPMRLRLAPGIIFALLFIFWPAWLHAKDNTNDYLYYDNDSNAIFKIAVVTNGVTPVTRTNDLPTLWFPVGEDIVYDIYWGVIHVGSTRVVTDWVEQDGKLRLRVRHLSKTNRVVAQVYPVEDTIETLIDPVPFLPVYFRKRLSEGRYRSDELTVFDHAAGVGKVGSFRSGGTKAFKIEPDTRDIVTMMYWLRKARMVPKQENAYRVMADEKIYDLKVRVGEEETRKVGSYGKVKTLRLDPEASFNGLFMRKGRISVWVSNDDRQLCTRIEAEVPVANIHIQLDRVSGPGDDAWVKRDGK